MLGRTNAGGSGSGGTLTVTGVVGDTITVSKVGKTYSRTFNSSGIATFKGLKSGKWTVTMTGSSGTATRTVEISADYELTMTYFSATINVTYPEGSTCTATDGTTTLTAPDTSGTWACVVPNAGTWTVTATDGTQTKSLAVSITTEGQVETVELTYKLWIIKDGILQTGFSITKGLWSDATATATPSSAEQTQKDGYLTVWSSSAGYLVIYPTFELTNFKTLTIDCNHRYGISTPLGFSSIEYVNKLSFVAKINMDCAKKRKTYTLDVSDISGTVWWAWNSNSNQIGVDFYNMWLE